MLNPPQHEQPKIVPELPLELTSTHVLSAKPVAEAKSVKPATKRQEKITTQTKPVNLPVSVSEIQNKDVELIVPSVIIEGRMEAERTELQQLPALLIQEELIMPENLPHDSNPVFDEFKTCLEDINDAPQLELRDHILEYIETVDFETAREIEITLISIAAYEKVIVQAKESNVPPDAEIVEKLELLYVELAEQLGINTEDTEAMTQFKALIQQLLPAIVPAEFEAVFTDRGTHEFLYEDTGQPKHFDQVIRNSAENFSIWIGRYTLLLAVA